MTGFDVVREVDRFVGKIQEADLENLIFIVKTGATVQEVDCTVSDCGVTFTNEADATVVVDAGDIVGARWVASGAIQSGTLTDSY